MLYFSYGSNLSSRRLIHRVPSATVNNIAILPSHQLVFHKVSYKDCSAKCDARETGNPEDAVYGVVFEIDAEEKPFLDKVEGLGYGYEQKQVLLHSPEGGVIKAFTYYATLIDPVLKPYDWYKEHVFRGAMEHGLPEQYINMIKAVETIHDPSTERRLFELSIYD